MSQDPQSNTLLAPAPNIASVCDRQPVHLRSISGRSSRDCAYMHREFKQLITKAIFFFYYYFLQTKLINQITQDVHYAKLNQIWHTSRQEQHPSDFRSENSGLMGGTKSPTLELLNLLLNAVCLHFFTLGPGGGQLCLAFGQWEQQKRIQKQKDTRL